MGRILVIASAFAVLIASGVVHGLWTDRWSDQTDLIAASQKLHELPMKLGAWYGSDVVMDEDPRSGLAGMIARRYVHATSGKGVTLFLACGRSKSVCTHTPDVCYRANGFQVEQPQRFQLGGGKSKGAPEFWTARFVKERADGKTHLRIFWSWYSSESWKVADNPRLSEFANERLLYKMYLIREMIQTDEPMEADPCVEFMHDLLPALKDHVFTNPM